MCNIQHACQNKSQTKIKAKNQSRSVLTILQPSCRLARFSVDLDIKQLNLLEITKQNIEVWKINAFVTLLGSLCIGSMPAQWMFNATSSEIQIVCFVFMTFVRLAKIAILLRGRCKPVYFRQRHSQISTIFQGNNPPLSLKFVRQVALMDSTSTVADTGCWLYLASMS